MDKAMEKKEKKNRVSEVCCVGVITPTIGRLTQVAYISIAWQQKCDLEPIFSYFSHVIFKK